jgi:hypothetical protein
MTNRAITRPLGKSKFRYRGLLMKLLLIAMSLFSITAFADDCKIITTATVKYYPLAVERASYVYDAVDLQDCVEEAKSKHGTFYQGTMCLPGGIDSSGGCGTVTYKVRRVKYSMNVDGILYTGKIK